MMDYWVIILITLLFSAFFSGMEIAFISSNKLKIELDKDKDISSGLIAFFSKMPSRFVGALLLGNNIALVFYGIYMSKILQPVVLELLPSNYENEFLAMLIQTIVSTLIILLFAEFIPKALFQMNPNNTLKVFSVPVVIFYYLFYPIIHLYTGISSFLIKNVLRIKTDETEMKFGYTDLHNYVEEYQLEDERGKDKDVDDLQYLKNAMDLGNIRLRECMIPRTELVAVEDNEDVSVLLSQFIETGFTRILVYNDNIDNIIGYVHSGDLFKKPKSIKDIIREIPFYPETMMANDILSKFMLNKTSIAVVLDEFGGTSGIISMEDLIEEILGEIDDEFDDDEYTERKISDTEYLFSGRLEIDYLNDKYDLNLPKTEEYETIAGLILHHHESIPEKGICIQIENFRFKIINVSNTKIESVMVSQNIPESTN